MSTAIIAAAFAIAIGCGMAALVWASTRRTKRPTPPIPIFDEAPADLVLKPWSETRGFYFFRSSDIPGELADLFAVGPDGVFRQFGEDEADALAALNIRLRMKAIELDAKLPPLVVASSVSFRPLNKRKARTP